MVTPRRERRLRARLQRRRGGGGGRAAGVPQQRHGPAAGLARRAGRATRTRTRRRPSSGASCCSRTTRSSTPAWSSARTAFRVTSTRASRPTIRRSTSRGRFQAVTAACMLVRRDAFEQAGGFDTAFRNSLEDVDLCLRLGAARPRGPLLPRERARTTSSRPRAASARRRSRATRACSASAGPSRAERDDFDYYLEDGLIGVRLPRLLSAARSSSRPLLAGLPAGRPGRRPHDRAPGRAGGRAAARDRAARPRRSPSSTTRAPRRPARHARPVDGGGRSRSAARGRAGPATRGAWSWRSTTTRRGVAAACAARSGGAATQPFEPGEALRYREPQDATCTSWSSATVPAAATVLVVTRGDEDLLELGDRRGRHFPEDADGRYSGHHPKDSQEAIDRLERCGRRAPATCWSRPPRRGG